MSTTIFQNIKTTGQLIVGDLNSTSQYKIVSVDTDTYSITNPVKGIINLYACDSSSNPITINLPQILSLISNTIILMICDVGGYARTNNITIIPYSGDNICGADSIIINNNYNSFELISNNINSWIL